MQPTHTWKFFRAGGFDQVQLDSAADLLALSQLDQKLWVALSCPTRGIEFDPHTLDMLDADGDGQVRASEVLAAIDWAGAMLKDAAVLAQPGDSVALSNIAEGGEGSQLLASARLILHSLGKPDAGEISLADLADTAQRLAAANFNGDGVVCPGQVEDASLRSAIEDMISVVGSVPDRSGDAGVSQALADRFFAEAQAYIAWYGQGEADAAISLLGADSQAAASAMQAVQGKVDDYYTRCQLAAYDQRAAAPLSRAVEDYQQLAGQQLSSGLAEVAAFPLATIAAGKPLPLRLGLNPAWQARIEALRAKVIQPLLGDRESLSQEEWEALCGRFAAHAAWQAAKPADAVASLGVDRLRQLLGGGHQAALNALIAQDLAIEAEIEGIRQVERLLRYRRDLFTLANNFVSFREFYSGRHKSIFQVGTLFLDGRSCELCVRVDEVNAHAAYAGSSGVCLAYCELVRNGGAEKMSIAAAFTAGDADFLMVGRHGVFYDRKGQDWSAMVVRIVDHPISIRQAFWSPYKKLSRTISEQMQKFAASRANVVQEKMVKAVAEGTSTVAAATPAAAPKAPFDVAKFAGIFAAIGLAIGAIGGILASIVGGIFSLKLWQVPLAVAGLMLAVSGPSMILAWFKLKRRNLGPILDACGWAINARVRINIPFGTSLTALPVLPPGAHRSLVDPYAEKKPVWPYFLALLVLLAGLFWAWHAGLLSR